jgi:hypothetical protein
MSDHIELVGLGVSMRRMPLSEHERALLAEGLQARATRAAADLAIRAHLSANGVHGPAADAAVLMDAGFFPVGSIQSPDYAPPAHGLANV